MQTTLSICTCNTTNTSPCPLHSVDISYYFAARNYSQTEHYNSSSWAISFEEDFDYKAINKRYKIAINKLTKTNCKTIKTKQYKHKTDKQDYTHQLLRVRDKFKFQARSC